MEDNDIQVCESEFNYFGGISNSRNVKHYKFITGGVEHMIGSVHSIHNEGLGFAFHIEPDFQGKGIGRKAFNMAFTAFSQQFDVKYIEGSWEISAEYAYREDGASTNLTVFNQALSKGVSIEEAALSTPTGKYASVLGYKTVEMLFHSYERSTIRFHK